MRSTVLLALGLKALEISTLFILFLRTNLDRAYVHHHIYVPAGKTKSEALTNAEMRFRDRLAPCDGQYYLEIALDGYKYEGEPNYAFFPLLPGILRVFNYCGIDPIWGGLAFNSIVWILGIVFLLLLNKGMDKRVSFVFVILFCLYPAAGFYHVLYTESLFLFLSSGAILLMRSHRPVAAGCFGYLAGLTRPQGVLLMLPLLIELWQGRMLSGAQRCSNRRFLTSMILALSPAIGMLTFALYVGQHTGSMLSVFTIQREWGREFGVIGLSQLLLPGYATLPTDTVAFTFGLILIPFMFKRLPPSLAVFGFAMLCFPLASGSFRSLFRFMGQSFPHFLCLALILEHRPWLLGLTLFASFVLHVWVNRALISWVVFA